MSVSQPESSAIDDKKLIAKFKRQIRYRDRKLREMDEELARDGIAVRPNEKGATALLVFDTKAGRWTSPPDDFDVHEWRKNWRKRRLSTPKVQPPPRSSFPFTSVAPSELPQPLPGSPPRKA